MVEKEVEYTFESIWERAASRVNSKCYEEKTEDISEIFQLISQNEPELLQKAEEFMRRSKLPLSKMPEMCICLMVEYQTYLYEKIRSDVESALSS
jgi:hypothetical protein